MSTAKEWSDWMLDRQLSVKGIGLKIDALFLPQEKEPSIIEMAVVAPEESCVTTVETKDHSLVVRINGVKVCFDQRVATEHWFLRYSKEKK